MVVPEHPDDRPSTGAPPQSPLVIRLFGELSLHHSGERAARLESARARSLLAYLLLHRDGPQSRQRMAFLLWPDSSEGQARTNLRHLLHTLRRAAPDLHRHLGVTAQTVWWRPEIPCWIDVFAFEDSLSLADAPGTSAEHSLLALREAIDSYTGDLLEGCYDEWALEERGRFRERYLSVLHRVAETVANRGEHDEANRVGRELLRCDPLREDTYRFLMRVSNAAGDRAGAVRMFHECVSVLESELGVGPSPETRETFAEIMRAESSDAPEPPTVRISDGALVGRDAEFELLLDCWRDAERGRSRMVLITGEPGVGKTRLVEELAAWCGRRGALVAEARSYPTEGELGYGAAISWLRVGIGAAQIRRGMPSDTAVLGRLLPELAHASSDPRLFAAVNESDQRRQVFDVIARTLDAQQLPTLLIADDAQWCDEQSLQLLHYLLRLDQRSPLLVVATARREDLDESHPLGVLISGLQIIDRITEIALGRLTRAATGQLVGDLAERNRDSAGSDRTVIDPTSIDDLFSETEGNPLFIVETMRAGWIGAHRDGAQLPPKLHAVINVRLRRLSEPARELLALAAAVGREFSTAVLAGASALDETSLVRSLDELWRRGIIREHGTDAYDFAHGQIRVVAYDALSPATRRRNHRLIAETLRELHARDLDTISGEVARHYDLAAQLDQTVAWYLRAALQAQRLHANVEAIRLLDRARDLAAELTETDTRMARELEILSALSTPLAVVEGFASIRLVQTQRKAIELSGVLGRESEPSLLRSLAMTNLCRNDFAGATAVAGQLEQSARRVGDDVLLVESEYLLGIGAFWAGAMESARSHFQRVVDTFEPARRADHLLRFGQDPRIVCLSRLANALWFLGFSERARLTRDEAVAMAAEVGHPFSRAVTLVFAALLSVDLDETDRFREYVAALTGGEQGQSVAVATEVFLGYVEVLDGRTRQGLARIRSAIDTNAADHAPGQNAAHTHLLVAAYDVAGDPSGGLVAADDALGMGGTRIWEAENRRLRAVFLAALGAPPAEVEAELNRARDAARLQGAVAFQPRVERSRSDLLKGR